MPANDDLQPNLEMGFDRMPDNLNERDRLIWWVQTRIRQMHVAVVNQLNALCNCIEVEFPNTLTNSCEVDVVNCACEEPTGDYGLPLPATLQAINGIGIYTSNFYLPTTCEYTISFTAIGETGGTGTVAIQNTLGATFGNIPIIEGLNSVGITFAFPNPDNVRFVYYPDDGLSHDLTIAAVAIQCSPTNIGTQTVESLRTALDNCTLTSLNTSINDGQLHTDLGGVIAAITELDNGAVENVNVNLNTLIDLKRRSTYEQRALSITYADDGLGNITSITYDMPVGESPSQYVKTIVWHLSGTVYVKTSETLTIIP